MRNSILKITYYVYADCAGDTYVIIYVYIYMSFDITVYRLFAEDCCLKSNFPQHFSDPNGTRGC